jgi:hypothetical protein
LSRPAEEIALSDRDLKQFNPHIEESERIKQLNERFIASKQNINQKLEQLNDIPFLGQPNLRTKLERVTQLKNGASIS